MEARLWELVEVRLSNPELVQAYGQRPMIKNHLRNTTMQGIVVYKSTEGRIGVQFEEQVLQDADIDRNQHNGVQTAFGKGKLGHCLYFESLKKLPSAYRVMSMPAEGAPSKIDGESYMKFHTAIKARRIGQSFQQESMRQSQELMDSLMKSQERGRLPQYVAGVDPYKADLDAQAFVFTVYDPSKPGTPGSIFPIEAIKARIDEIDLQFLILLCP